MTHLSQNLDKLIQMISIEQLLGIVKQTNNSNSNSISDILSLPIVQKVVKAYEDEIEMLKSKMNTNTNTSCNKCCLCKDYSDDISKIHEQLATINTTLNATIQNMQINNSVNDDNKILDDEHIRLKIEEKEDSSKLESLEAINLAVVNLEDDDEEEELEEDDEESVVPKVEEEELEEDDEVSVVPKVEEEELEEESLEEEELEEESLEEESVASLEEESVVPKVEEEESEKEISDSESEVEVEVDQKVEEDEDDEEEVFEIEIDDITYYATGEENGILYSVDDDGEVGKQVGIIKDGEPIFS